MKVFVIHTNNIVEIFYNKQDAEDFVVKYNKRITISNLKLYLWLDEFSENPRINIAISNELDAKYELLINENNYLNFIKNSTPKSELKVIEKEIL